MKNYFGVVGAIVISTWLMPVIAEESATGFKNLRIEYQYIHTREYVADKFNLDIGSTDSHAIFTSIDYVLNERLSFSASLPWIRKRHQGPTAHNALLDFNNYVPDSYEVV